MKKIKVIVFSILISSLVSLTNSQDVFITDSKEVVIVLFTLLGLAFTSFSFISNSINKIIEKSNGRIKNESISDFFKEIKSNIKLILISSIIIALTNALLYFDFPFINNPLNIDFSLFEIISLKVYIANFITSFLFCLTIYAYYDIMEAMFTLFKINFK